MYLLAFIKTISIFCSLCLFLSSTGYSQKFYSWVDETGKVHYSDKLPPEAVPRPHRKISTEGIVVEQIDQAKTAEEIARERALAQAQEAQAREDRLLLSRYKTLADIDRAKTERLKLLDARIDFFLIKQAELQRDAEATLAEIRRHSQQNRSVPDTLRQRMDTIWRQDDEYKRRLLSLRQSRQEALEKFDLESKRFRELKP